MLVLFICFPSSNILIKFFHIICFIILFLFPQSNSFHILSTSLPTFVFPPSLFLCVSKKEKNLK